MNKLWSYILHTDVSCHLMMWNRYPHKVSVCQAARLVWPAQLSLTANKDIGQITAALFHKKVNTMVHRFLTFSCRWYRYSLNWESIDYYFKCIRTIPIFEGNVCYLKYYLPFQFLITTHIFRVLPAKRGHCFDNVICAKHILFGLLNA